MRKTLTITPDKISKVKMLLKDVGVNEAARKAGVSQYTVSMIKAGKYENDKPLQAKRFEWNNRCPITGMKIV